MSTPPPRGLPASITVVVPLARAGGVGAHVTADRTAREALEGHARRWGGRVDWNTLEVVTGPLIDLLDNTTRDDLAGLRATATVVPL